MTDIIYNMTNITYNIGDITYDIPNITYSITDTTYNITNIHIYFTYKLPVYVAHGPHIDLLLPGSFREASGKLPGNIGGFYLSHALYIYYYIYYIYYYI